MNWRRGFLRLWIVASACWLMLVGAVAYQKVGLSRQAATEQAACADARRVNPTLGNPFDCFDSRLDPFADCPLCGFSYRSGYRDLRSRNRGSVGDLWFRANRLQAYRSVKFN